MQREGWLDDTYFVFFDESELASISAEYGIVDMMPGFQVVGLCSWDDFLLRDSHGRLFTAPTVPCIPAHLAECDVQVAPGKLQPDERFTGKIKWYLQPLVFGGDPRDSRNIAWITRVEHAQLIRFWWAQYRAAVRGQSK